MDKSSSDSQIFSDYSINNSPLPKLPSQNQEISEKVKGKLDKLKGFIVKKFPFTEAIGLLSPVSVKIFVEDEEAPKETMNHTHLYVVIPEEKFKETEKIKKEILAEVDKSKEKIWVHLRTPVDIWEACLDSRFDIVSSIALSVPLFDKGILSALRVSEIHKSLVLRKFDKYVVSYVLGGSLVRGEATKTSDVDVFVIINDTDVKRMPRLELKERLRQQIYRFIAEAESLAGVGQNVLNVQVYLLTDFWEYVKDAHPVMFTFIRDGVPTYDKGTFLPWKTLLRMGKLKPSPESIDIFMSSGDKTGARVKRFMLDSLTEIFWSINTPSQALLMLYGLPPPNVKETVKQMREIFYKKEKMIEKKYIDILEKVIKYWKDYEHGKIKSVSGKEIDSLLKDTEDYIKRLKELRKQIEKRTQEKTIEQLHKDVFELLKSIFGNKPQKTLVSEFENLVKKGKMPNNHIKILNNIVDAKSDFKKGKLDSHKIENARRQATILINSLVEYNQRKDIVLTERERIKIKHDGKTSELILLNGQSFLINGNEVKKITDKIYESNTRELDNAISQNKPTIKVEVKSKIFEILRKEIGDFEIIF